MSVTKEISNNYQFNLPSWEDSADVTQLTDNWRKADENLRRIEDNFDVYSIKQYSGSTEAEINSIYNSFSNDIKGDRWYRAYVIHGTAHSVLGGGNWYLEGVKTTSDYEWQKITCYQSQSMFVRQKRGGTWGAWDKITLNSEMKQSGLLDPNLSSVVIVNGGSFTRQNLLERNVTTFFTNVDDVTDFPIGWGSGVMLPCNSTTHRIIFYSSTAYGSTNPPIYVGVASKTGNAWSVKWNEIDGDYLPLSGGTITGNLKVNGQLSGAYGDFSGALTVHNGKSVFSTKDVIPIKNGGTGGTDVPTARRNLGFIQGFYKGNGLSDMRTFDIAKGIGDIGHTLLIWSSTNTMKAIVTPEGGTAWFDDGGEATLSQDDKNEICYFSDGKLHLQVKNEIVGINYCNLMNQYDAIYYYQVL